MKNTKFLLKIENPCHESWDEMTTSENGKFCAHCAKNVTDFSKMTDAQIVQFLEQSNGSFCGRLTSTQMNRIIELQQQYRSPNYAALVAGVLALGATNTALAANSNHQEIKIVSASESNVAIDQINTGGDSTRNYIEGNVKDFETNEDLFSVKIMVKGYPMGAYSDLDGNFKINLPDSLSGKKITLSLSSIEYDSLEVIVNDRSEFQKLYLRTSIELIQTIGIVVVDKHPGKTKRRMKREERKNKPE